MGDIDRPFLAVRLVFDSCTPRLSILDYFWHGTKTGDEQIDDIYVPSAVYL